MTLETEQVIGVIPSAGTGSRVAPLPGSKELFPIGFMEFEFSGETHRYPKAICQYLIESMSTAGVKRIYIILSDSKWDIFQYLGDGSRLGVNLAYLSVKEMRGMPYSINQVYPWSGNSTIVFGMPDTIIKPRNAFVLLLDKYHHSKADLTLGLFPAHDPSRFGMVELDDANAVMRIVDKPKKTDLKYLWGIACWGSKFKELLNQEIWNTLKLENNSTELLLGDIFQTAIEEGLKTNACIFDQGEYIDIGDPIVLAWAIRKFSQ